MIFKLLSIVILLSISSVSVTFAQLKAQKTTRAVRTLTAPELDGHLEPEVWQQAPAATDFIKYDPHNGKPASQQTEVYVLYDNDAVYIGALLRDTAPDSILTQYGERDSGENNSDMFGIYLDTYNDKQNAFAFIVSAAGVQTDIKVSQSGEDRNWDAVWVSKVQKHEEGWTVEMRIPYGAIRFPKSDVQNWGVNFMRVVRRKRERSYWSHIDNSIRGRINQAGFMSGISGIQSPVRLQLTPYISGYVNHYPSNIENKSNIGHSINGGMDVKYGINDAFTLDMTLVPDFGQTQSDNQILNLSPFEVQFQENRSFFTEGTELFNKGNLFYSRRIGGTPINRNQARAQLQPGEQLIENPTESSLVNATKISGRTKKGLGIGIFNAITRRTNAIAEDEAGNRREIMTDPATNYNVFVLDQTLPNNSFVTLTNTNVTRSSNLHNANVTGLQVRLAESKNMFALRAGGNLSQIHSDFTDEAGNIKKLSLGHQYNISLAKVSGNLKYNFNHHVESDTYEINDLGFLKNNNEITNSASLSYNFYQPVWKFLNWRNNLNVRHTMLYAPREFSSYEIRGGSNVKFRNFVSAGLNMAVRPDNAYDFFEARNFPSVFVRPSALEASANVSSDYRKRVAFDANTGVWHSDFYNQTTLWYGISPRFRVSDKLLLVNNNSVRVEEHNIGYAKKEAGTVLFGDRDVTTFTTTLSGAYIFNENTGLTLNMRHYWSRAEYNSLHVLNKDGFLGPTLLEEDGHIKRMTDINFNTFNIDLVYAWRFAPGSEVRIVWKNAIQERTNEIRDKYHDNFYQTIQAPQNNNFSIKLLYFLDYIALKRVLSA